MTFLPLDHLIFGNGHGFAAPHFDQRYYWLSGELYTFSQGLGAQLHSVQWTHPNAGERRTIHGQTFRPFHSHRSWGRVIVAWAWCELPRGLNEANAALRELGRVIGTVSEFRFPEKAA